MNAEAKTKEKKLAFGAVLVILCFFNLAATNALVKVIGPGLQSPQILFIQYFIDLCFISAICLWQGKKIGFLKTTNYGWLFIRSLGGLFGFFFVYISLAYVTVADATLLLNTSPFFLPLIALLLFREPISHKLWWGIIPGFIGIAFILRPQSGIFQWHSLVPLLSGVSVALVFISLRELHKRFEPTLRILFYLFFFATCITLPFAINVWKTPSLRESILLVITAVTSFLAQTLVTVGLRYGSPQALVPLSYTSVIFALLFDWLIWGVIPCWTCIIGITLVIVSGVITLIIENQKS